MIDERMEEQAALHVLGALSEQEAREFKAILHANPELQEYVARLSTATGVIAGSVPLVEPPPQLRAKILDAVAPKQKTLSPQEPAPAFSWLPWWLAAGLAVLCLGLFMQYGRLQDQVTRQTRQIADLSQLAQSLQDATNNLQKAVIALQETNRLANLRIAMLNSKLADNPAAEAVSLWDESKQEGVFVVENLKPLPSDRDYQLWVIDPNYKNPVDAGVFQVDIKGNVRVSFKTKSHINRAQQFAVTEETRGGVNAPTLKNLVLASR